MASSPIIIFPVRLSLAPFEQMGIRSSQLDDLLAYDRMKALRRYSEEKILGRTLKIVSDFFKI
jgi:hypothetical protein